MDNPGVKVVDTSLSHVYDVNMELEGSKHVASFKMNDERGGGAMVSFDGGKTWVDARLVHHAIGSFSDRFPDAIEPI